MARGGSIEDDDVGRRDPAGGVSPEESERATSSVWYGEITLRPGDEAKSYVEITNSSQCDVRIIGELVPDRD